MSDEIRRFQCRHIFTDGRRCGSACLRHEEFCYYHHTTRRPVENPRRRRSRQAQFSLPLPEDRSAIQSSIGEVLRRIAGNEIDSKRAGLLLYGLQIASINLPRTTAPNRSTTSRRYAEDAPETTLVEEIVIDPKLGTLAPRAEVREEEEHLSVVGQLLIDLDREQKEREAEKAAARAQSVALATPPSPLEHAVEAQENPMENPNQTAVILPTIQANEPPKQTREHPKDFAKRTCAPLRHPAKPARQEKSAIKLTRTAQIAIVRGFREYPDRVIRETRCAEG
jgi:hypothetical protein